MNQRIDAQVVEHYKRQGFRDEEIQRALGEAKSTNHFENLLLSMRQSQSIIHTNEEQLLQQAIAASLLNNKLVDPLSIQRGDKIPCGLKNVGNTCYFNSLLQTYFFNYEFVSAILKWKNPNITVGDKRIEISFQLLQHLQALFVRMIGSDRKYVDPSIVLKSICDDFGNALPIGDQKDVGEFNHYFLSRIDEGLAVNKSSQSMIIEQQTGSQIIQQGGSQVMTQQQSMLRRQSSVVSENSIVQKLFFGKITSEIFANDVQIKVNPISDMFNFIQIDVNHKTLTEGLERYMNQSIDYKTENNYIPAIKQLWITQAPEVLSFQIQRVQFNKESGTAAKINSFFHFDNELCIEKYLFANSKTAKSIQSSNVQLKERMKKIEIELQQFTQFNGNIDIINNLETSLQFLKIQNQTESKNPYYVDSNDNKAAIQQVTSYLQHLTKRRDCLKKEMEECEKKVSASYNGLKKNKYVLQSILMHEGSPDAGHYYAYIYNFEQKLWFCFNDTNVTVEEQEKVLINAYGDQHHSKSAYLLTYIKEEASKKGLNSMIPLRSFRISTIKEKNQYLADGYGQMLSQQQREILTNENNYFKQELEEIKQQQASEKILEKYSLNIEKANEKFSLHQQCQQINLRFKLTPLCSLGVYAKYKQNETLFKWLAFDSAVKSFTSQGVFEEPQINTNFKQLLLSQINSKLGSYKTPSSPQPSVQDLVKIRDDYFTLIKYTTMALFVTEQYINNNFITTLQSLQQYTKAVKLFDQKSFFYEFAIFLKHQVLLGILAKMIKVQVVQESDINVLKLLIAYQMQDHFQYKDPKFWKEQIINLIDVISGYNQLKKTQFNEITKPAYDNKKNVEAFQQLEKPCEGLLQMIDSMIQTYSETDFYGPDEDLLIENLQFRIQTLEKTKITKILFDKISSSQTILDPQQVQQIILDYQQ